MNERIDSRNLARLPGQVLTSVMVTMNCVTLKFVKYPVVSDGGFVDEASIDIETGFVCLNKGVRFSADQHLGLEVFRGEGATLVVLIDKLIQEAQQSKGGELLLRFDDGASLEIAISPQGFESYHVHQKGGSTYTAVFYPEMKGDEVEPVNARAMGSDTEVSP